MKLILLTGKTHYTNHIDFIIDNTKTQSNRVKFIDIESNEELSIAVIDIKSIIPLNNYTIQDIEI